MSNDKNAVVELGRCLGNVAGSMLDLYLLHSSFICTVMSRSPDTSQGTTVLVAVKTEQRDGSCPDELTLEV